MKGGAGAALAGLAVTQTDPLWFAGGDDLERAAMALADPSHDAFPGLRCFTFAHRNASFCFTYPQA
jgi:hypothetical protein